MVDLMTKLEQKLIGLGYEKSNIPRIFIKRIYCNNIQLTICGNTILLPKIQTNNIIEYQEEIDNLQQAYNEMQKDLEVLKQCQD